MRLTAEERLHLPRTPAPSVALCRPDAWGRVSFAATPVSILGWIYDPDHSLPPGMYVDVPHLDRPWGYAIEGRARWRCCAYGLSIANPMAWRDDLRTNFDAVTLAASLRPS